jgi:hypothetical protein
MFDGPTLKANQDESNYKGQALFYAIFAVITLGFALMTFYIKAPVDSNLSDGSLIVAKLIFVIICMILNAVSIVKFIQCRSKIKKVT